MVYVLELKNDKIESITGGPIERLARAKVLDTKFGKYTSDIDRIKVFQTKAEAKKYKDEFDRSHETKIVNLEEFLTTEEKVADYQMESSGDISE
jgi:hypothetical protein